MASNDIAERLLGFAVSVGKLVDLLPDTRLARHVAGQLVRCGTSPLPNYQEACAAESRADFVHKLQICLKELRETRVWLRFIAKADLLVAGKLAEITEEAHELCNIIGKSVVTAKRNARKKNDPNSI